MIFNGTEKYIQQIFTSEVSPIASKIKELLLYHITTLLYPLQIKEDEACVHPYYHRC